MKEDRLRPKRRFKEFENGGAWEERKLGDIADVRDGTHDSPQYYSEGHPFVTSKNVKYGYINYDDIQYISDVDFEIINKRSKVDKNDILMGMIGTIGNIALVREKPDFAIKNVALIKDTKKIYYVYLYHYLQSVSILNQLSEGMDGGTQKFIALNKIRNLIISAPKYEEQFKIGTFFSNIDNLIILHQRKLKKLKETKSAYLSEMFPKEGEKYPKRRFDGFTDPWEQRKLSDFADKAVDNRGKTPPLDLNGNHPLIEVASLGGSSPDYTKIEKYLNELSFQNNLRDYIKEGDILFSTVGSIGLVSMMDDREEAAIAQNIVAFRAKENYLPEYLYVLFSTEENAYKAYRIVMGAVQPSLKVSQLVNVEYYVTKNKKEQELIGKHFVQLDNLITLHQRKLEKLENLKKAYLNEMFV